MDEHTIGIDGLSATIKADGAELCSLIGPDEAEYLWQAGPAWPRHAPILFPIVGRLKGDVLRHNGREYRLTQHGFARDRTFQWMERTRTHALLELIDNGPIREMYPFPFRLEISYETEGNSLTQIFSVTNTGYAPMPVSFGAHPAFVWPLRPGLAKEDHTLTFSADETCAAAPAVRRADAGGAREKPDRGARAASERGPVRERRADFRSIRRAIRSVTRRPGGPAITVAWQGMPQLGIWTKPADFLCIEPWHGFASPENFDGEFSEKPGVALIDPGQTVSGSIVITISSNPD